MKSLTSKNLDRETSYANTSTCKSTNWHWLNAQIWWLLVASMVRTSIMSILASWWVNWQRLCQWCQNIDPHNRIHLRHRSRSLWSIWCNWSRMTIRDPWSSFPSLLRRQEPLNFCSWFRSRLIIDQCSNLTSSNELGNWGFLKSQNIWIFPPK